MFKKKLILLLSETRLNAWPDECFLFSIVQNCSTGYDWLMNTFVQMVIQKNDTRVNFLPSGKHYTKINAYDFFPYIMKHKISYNMLNALELRFTDVVIWAISKGYYISANLIQSFRVDDAEKKMDHKNYFYGYDITNQVFYVADNFNNGEI